MIARFYAKLRGDTIDFVEHPTGNWVEYEDHRALLDKANAAIKEAYANGKKEAESQERVRAAAAKWGGEKY